MLPCGAVFCYMSAAPSPIASLCFFDWLHTIPQFLYIESSDYELVQPEILRIVSLASFSQRFRQEHLPVAVNVLGRRLLDSVLTNVEALVDLLEVLIHTHDDVVLFCREGGLPNYSKVMFSAAKLSSAAFEKTVALLVRTSRWLQPVATTTIDPVATTVIMQWESRHALRLLLSNNPPGETSAQCRATCQQLLRILESISDE
jgi:hypothetical protein